MNLQAVETTLSRTRLQRNVAFVLFGVMLLSNVLIGAKFLSQTNQVVLVPTNVSDGMVARGAADKRYIEALALDAVYAMYNASPGNLDYGRHVIERISSVGERNTLLRHYDEIGTDIRERDIATVFFPRQIEHNPESLDVIVDGVLQTYLNTVQIAAEPRRLLLTFVSEAGSVRLSRISRLEVDS